MSNEFKYVMADQLRKYCADLFQSVGVPHDEALVIADNLVDADLCGVESHGVSRMAIYMKRLRMGGVRSTMEYKKIVDAPAMAVVDACNSMGAPVSKMCMELAIEKAKTAGISFVSVRNSNHYGMAAYYTKMALAHDMIGFTASNTCPRIAPWGSREPLFGTNPFSYSFPTSRNLPVIPDMASCVVARGKLIVAAKRNEPIPLGWAMTKDGEDTTDAVAGLKGANIPFGTYKGSAVAGIVEIMTGILANCAFSTQIPDLYDVVDGPAPVSHFFGAIDISKFMPVDKFKHDVDDLIDLVKNSEKAKGFDKILMPGEIEFHKKEERLKSGIKLPRVVADELRAEGATCGVPFLI